MKTFFIRLIVTYALVLALPYIWNLLLAKVYYMPHMDYVQAFVLTVLVALCWQHL